MIDFSELENEMNWLQEILARRADNALASADEVLENCPVPTGNSPYGELVKRFGLSVGERAIFILALSPHFSPEVPEILIRENEEELIRFSETGGRKGIYQNGNLPTMQTALFMLGGRNIAARMQAMHYFSDESRLSLSDLVQIVFPDNSEPDISGLLRVPDYILSEISGKENSAADNLFCQLHSGKRNWDDLVFNSYTEKDLDQLRGILSGYRNETPENKNGLPVLFYGRRDTGKKTSAAILAEEYASGMLRLDLSAIEILPVKEQREKTEQVFRRAFAQNLFVFIEAGDSFSKEKINGSYALPILEILAQLINRFKGIVFLSSVELLPPGIIERIAFKAFVQFGLPQSEEREKLWRRFLPGNIQLEENDLKKISSLYFISAQGIKNIIGESLRRMKERKSSLLTNEDIREAAAIELIRSGKKQDS